MSVLVYTESEQGKFKKVALEAVSYAKGIADMIGSQVVAVSINAEDSPELGKYGASKHLQISDSNLDRFQADPYASAIAQVAKAENADVVVISSTADSKFLAPALAIELEAGYIPNAVALPESSAPFKVKSSVFTNKAFAMSEINTATKLVGLSKNA